MYRIIGADGNQYGPISAEQLRQWIAEGRANAQTKVLAEGTTEWKPLSEFPEFFGTSTPPAPGAPPPSPTMPAMPFSSYSSSAAAEQVSGPAIGLIITGALNIVLALVRGVMMLAGLGMGSFQGTGNAEAEKM